MKVQIPLRAIRKKEMCVCVSNDVCPGQVKARASVP